MKQKRILLKISWEALAGWDKKGINPETVKDVVKRIIDIKKSGVEVWIVVWAWNFVRWAEVSEIDRTRADNMWMLAITMNAIAIQDAILKQWEEAEVYNSFWIDWIVDRFNKKKVLSDLSSWKIVVFWWGTGNPFFTTDTNWVLRAIEIEADAIIKATQVDWLYTKDPNKFDDAEFIENADYDRVLRENLRVMDQTAFALAKENNLTIKIVSFTKEGALVRACKGEKEWTTISA